ncbi:MAG: hypothetical protein AB7N71_13865, partial [Phycisphaerae bacterium]
MSGKRDPVDSAFEVLRSDDWTAQPFTKEMEHRFMNNASKSHGNVLAKPAVLVPVVGLLALGGVGFATGGVKALKTWLFDVEVEGTNARILVEDGQEGKILIEDEDGTTRE